MFGGSTGVRTEGESTADLAVIDKTGEVEVAIGHIGVAGGEFGIKAEGASVATLFSDTCTIEGADEAARTRTEGEAIIDEMCSSLEI